MGCATDEGRPVPLASRPGVLDDAAVLQRDYAASEVADALAVGDYDDPVPIPSRRNRQSSPMSDLWHSRSGRWHLVRGVIDGSDVRPSRTGAAMRFLGRRIVLAAFGASLLSMGGPASAQEAPDGCGALGVQAEVNDRAARDFAEADAALNAAWGPARDWAEDMDARAQRDQDTGVRIGPPGFGGLGEGQTLAQGLLDAQRSWLRYRDGHCAASAATFSGGSMWPMLYDACRAGLTRDPTDELRALVSAFLP